MSDANRKKTLRLSMIDGGFFAAMVGFTEQYLTPYALAMGATTPQIGLLTSMPNLFGSLSQMKAPEAAEKIGGRKKLILLSIFLQGLTWLPIIVIPWMVPPVYQVPALITLVTLFNVTGAYALPSWNSILSDYVPERKRGDFFGLRNRWMGLITVVCSFIAGAILHYYHRDLTGFSIIIGLAFVARMISWSLLTQIYDPPLTIRQEHKFTLWDFLGRFKESNFAKFVLFVACLSFTVNLISPFFSVYMLRDRHLSYLQYTVVNVTATIASLLAMRYWGKHADVIGNLQVIRLSCWMIPIIPFFWLVSASIFYLLLVQIVAGFFWAGFNLCATNFIFDAVSPEKRTRCIAYFNVLNGTAICLGSLMGGVIAPHLPPLLGYSLMTLMVISAVLRIAVVRLLLGKIKEVRLVQKVRSLDLFYSMIGMRPIFGISHDEETTFQTARR